MASCGARLARLAGKVQVMAVTHAPQVDARADHHLLISKDTLDKGWGVATRVDARAADHRLEATARMRAGAEITAEARDGATRVLHAASAGREFRPPGRVMRRSRTAHRCLRGCGPGSTTL